MARTTMVQDFRDSEQYDAIEKALDIAYPVFRLFGWTWASTGAPTRDEIEETLVMLTDNALKDIEENDEVQTTGCSTGRLSVEAHAEDGNLTVRYGMDLASGYGEAGCSSCA